MTRRIRSLIAASVATGVVLVLAGPAAAHIEPDLSAVPAGAKATVAFNVEHGCDESPTTKIEMKLPFQITDAKPVDKAGWTGSVKGDVLTFSGGSEPAHEPTSFSITFTPPTDAVGAKLSFPIIQTCAEGSVSWLGSDESDEHPAPVVTVGKVGTTATTAPADDDDEGGDEAPAVTTTTAAGSTTTTAATTEDEVTTTTKVAGSSAASSKQDDSSNTGVIVAGVVAAVVVIGGGSILALRMRKSE